MLYPQAQEEYIRAGWTQHFNILPVKGKSQDLPVGFTGYTTNIATPQIYELWAQTKPEYNITLALIADSEFVFFDVDTDAAKGKQGYAQWFEFWDSLGIDCTEIDAQCWISSARENPSARGQRLARVPKGLEWPSKLGPDIEIIRYGHRHAVVWPSIHPDTGTEYRWYQPGDTATSSTRIPTPEDISFTLPDAAVKKITGGVARKDRPARKDMDWVSVLDWLGTRAEAEGTPCDAMASQLDKATDYILNRHTHNLDVHHAGLKGTDSLIHLAHDGHAGAVTALNELLQVFLSVSDSRDSDPSSHVAEWVRMIQGSVAKMQGDPSRSCWCGRGISASVQPEPVKVTKTENTYKGSHGRTAVLTPMSAVTMRRAKWVWKDRISLGTLAILAGQPSMGKSQTAVWIAARLTRGELFGEFYGTPKDVIICATEDSFEYTIKPRLMAAGADPERVFRVDIKSRDDILDGLNLIEDRELLRAAVQDLDVALLILDPLMSRLGGKIDSHKDAEVRLALEPLVALAHECNFAVIGLMHFNKSGNTNPMNSLMGSVAFGAVARSVHICAPDSEDPTRRIFGTEKNNLGKTSGPGEHDLDTWRYYIEGVQMPTEDDDRELLTTSRIVWDGDSTNTITDSLTAIAKGEKAKSGVGSKLEEAIEWLVMLFDREGQAMPKAKILEIAKLDKFSKHSEGTLRRAIGEKEFGTLQTTVDGKRVAYWGLAEDIEELERGLN